MPELDVDIAELQRRAYGPDGNDLSPAERARLARFEAASRIPDPPAVGEAPALLAHAPAISGSESAGHEASSSGPAQPSKEPAGRLSAHVAGDPAAGSPAHATGRLRAGTSQPIGRGDASGRASSRDEAGERDRIRGAAARRGGRWFTPALIAAIGMSAVIVMLVAGGVGWGGGYAAGMTRHAGPGGGAEFVTELHPTEMPERFAEAAGGYYVLQVDPETGEFADGGTYFGSIGDEIDVFVNRPFGSEDGYRGLPSDSVCLNVTQTLQTTETTATFAGDSACGSPRLDVSVDLFAGVEDEVYPSGMRLATDAYPPDTLLRFTYSAAADIVTVWSLAPNA